jgi:hypothetical protein
LLHWADVNQKYVLTRGRLVQSTEPIKGRVQKRLNPVRAPVVLAPAGPGGEVVLFKKHPLSSPEVAVEKAGSR